MGPDGDFRELHFRGTTALNLNLLAKVPSYSRLVVTVCTKDLPTVVRTTKKFLRNCTGQIILKSKTEIGGHSGQRSPGNSKPPVPPGILLVFLSTEGGGSQE